MIIDNDLNIIQANESAKEFLKSVESDLRSDLPNFSADSLIGTNIDSFHKNPSHQRRMLADLKSPYMTSIKLGGHIFNLRASPIFADDGQRLGSIMEWFDSQASDNERQMHAINKFMAVIEFNLHGEILNANQNFLSAAEYSLDEIKGKHHRIFVSAEEANSSAYVEFWRKLAAGEFQQGRYRRIRKSGHDFWIEALYNPIFDLRGQPYKVVKFATDITASIEARLHVIGSMKQIGQELDAVSEQAAHVADASAQTTSNVSAVASGAEELRASVEEIARNMAHAEKEADLAVSKVQEASDGTQRLANAARDMTGIVELIDDLAGQVNLLALNAAIEAARAGEAGKGFGVVATEIKILAGKTSSATHSISEEIGHIQNGVDEAVRNLSEINTAISTLREFVASVAGAVEEQGAVSTDMSSNMQSAAQAVSDVNLSIEAIVHAVETIKIAVAATNSDASNL